VSDEVFMIGEIGLNHNGDMDLAKQLIDLAVECKMDAVKFQKRDINIVYAQEYLDSPRESPWGTTQREQKKGLELNEKEYDEIDRYCKEKGIKWFASAWDINSLEFLKKYDLKFNKVASAMIINEEFLKAVAKEKKTTFISSGMSNYEDIGKAIDIFDDEECKFVLMHCVSTYPCDDEECHISAIPKLKAYFDCPVGYSGHERGVTPSLIAAAFGAIAIERHITLDRTMYGSDQSASLEKNGLMRLVRDCKKTEQIFGDNTIRTKNRYVGQEEEISKKLRYWL